jgi:hypothetical protein
MPLTARTLLVLVLVAPAACVDHEPDVDRVGPGPVPEAGTACNLESDPTAELPCDVAVILKNRCQRCHQTPEVNGAPFPLVVYQDLLGDYGGPIYEAMYRAVKSDFMPYCAGGGLGCENLAGGPVEPLTPAEKQTLLDYLLCPKPQHGLGCAR